MIQIERADNGWVLTDHSDTENVRKHVFQEADGFDVEKSEAEAFASLLWAVKSIMGPSDSRYSAHRVYIEIKPGDKHSSHPDNQETEDLDEESFSVNTPKDTIPKDHPLMKHSK